MNRLIKKSFFGLFNSKTDKIVKKILNNREFKISDDVKNEDIIDQVIKKIIEENPQFIKVVIYRGINISEELQLKLVQDKVFQSIIYLEYPYKERGEKSEISASVQLEELDEKKV